MYWLLILLTINLSSNQKYRKNVIIWHSKININFSTANTQVLIDFRRFTNNKKVVKDNFLFIWKLRHHNSYYFNSFYALFRLICRAQQQNNENKKKIEAERKKINMGNKRQFYWFFINPFSPLMLVNFLSYESWLVLLSLCKFQVQQKLLFFWNFDKKSLSLYFFSFSWQLYKNANKFTAYCSILTPSYVSNMTLCSQKNTIFYGFLGRQKNYLEINENLNVFENNAHF
jgi:hypothetical protein